MFKLQNQGIHIHLTDDGYKFLKLLQEEEQTVDSDEMVG